jgi:chloride channel protein, CIC family
MKYTVRARFQLWLRHVRKRSRGITNPRLWFAAAMIGLVVGYGVVGFIWGIELITQIFFGTSQDAMATGIRDSSAMRTFLAPVIGSILVALLIAFGRRMQFLPRARCMGVAEVIEARAGPPGHLSFRGGLLNTVITALTLGSGASAGREGPAVLMGGAFATAFHEKLGLRGKYARTLIGCGAAAAVAASFNAPIAGVLFALEVILGNYALSVFGPVALSSVIATVITRIHLSHVHAFTIPEYGASGLYDVPLSIILGIISGIIAFGYMQSLASSQNWVKRFTRRYRLDPVLLVPVAGLFMGFIALFVPEIVGVGYEATSAALNGLYGLGELGAFLLLKIIATIVCLAFGYGTGIFSGGIYFGAMAGAAFGLIVAMLLPGLTADAAFYAMIGMGAVSGAILGAPISTTLIIFELTGDYQMTLNLMIAVGIATMLARVAFGSSFFHWQLNQFGYDLSEGPHGVILQTIRVRDVMRPVPADSAPLDDGQQRLRLSDSLGNALAKMRLHGLEAMPVVDDEQRRKLVGYLTEARALAAYNEALVEADIEHHK